MVSKLHEFPMHHEIGYLDTVTVLDHPTHACIPMCSDMCLTVHVELTVAHNVLIIFV